MPCEDLPSSAGAGPNVTDEPVTSRLAASKAGLLREPVHHYRGFRRVDRLQVMKRVRRHFEGSGSGGYPLCPGGRIARSRCNQAKVRSDEPFQFGSVVPHYGVLQIARQAQKIVFHDDTFACGPRWVEKGRCSIGPAACGLGGVLGGPASASPLDRGLRRSCRWVLNLPRTRYVSCGDARQPSVPVGY